MSKAEPAAAPDLAPVFAALGDATRLRLLQRLGDRRPRSITALAADTRLTRQAVTKHLHVLETAGLVASERTGRETRFSGCPEPLGEARRCLAAIEAGWDEALARLATHLGED